jgi:hypothetical protein
MDLVHVGDRRLAIARVIGVRLMTHDRAILDYARGGHSQIIRA